MTEELATSTNATALSARVADRFSMHTSFIDKTLAEYEAALKRAVGHIDKHMKRTTDPNSAVVPPEQKIDDFRRAATEFNSSAKTMCKQLRTLKDDVGATSSEFQGCMAAVTCQREAAEAASRAAPCDPSQSNNGAEVADNGSSSDGASIPVAREGNEADKKRIAELEQQIKDLQNANEALTSAAAASTANNASASEAAAELKRAQEESTATIATLNAQLQQMDNAFRNVQETFFRERDAMTKAVAALREEVDSKEREKQSIVLEVERLKATVDDMKNEYAEAQLERRAVEQRLEFAEKKRECDFTAFEHAMRDHEADLNEWQSKYSAAMMQLSRLRQDKEALEARVVYEHLREHIRVLQKENNALRDEHVKLVQSTAKDPNVMKLLTSAMQESIQALQREKTSLNDDLRALREQVQLRDRQLHDSETRHVEEVAALRRASDELDRRLRFFETRESEQKLRLLSAETYDGHQVMERNPDDSDDGAIIHNAECGGGSIPRRAADGRRPPARMTTLETWERSVQVDDLDRMHLERDVVRLRADNQELADDVARLQQNDHHARTEFQDRLIQQMRGFEAQVEGLEKETKVRAFKLAKLQQHNEVLEEQCRQLQRDIQQARQAAATAEQGQQESQRRFMSLEMERDALQQKVSSLRHEIEELHQHAADVNIAMRAQQAQSASAASKPLSTGSASSATTTPRGGTVSVRSVESITPASSNNPPIAASSTTKMTKNEAVKKLDNLMLELHHQSITLDNEEHQATADTEAANAKREQRTAYLEAARPFWGKERRQSGPNGETPSQMIEQIDREIAQLQQETIAASQTLQTVYMTVARKRAHLHAATTKIIEKRNMLLSAGGGK